MSARDSAPPVVLTRAREDNAALAAALRARGVRVVEWPALATRIVEPAGGAPSLRGAIDRCAVVAFTSRRGIEATRSLLPDLAAILGDTPTAAIGPATAAMLRDLGIPPRWIAAGTGSRDLADVLAASAPARARVLLLRSEAADDVLPVALSDAGFAVEDIRLYAPAEPERPAADPQALAAIVCASPSAARQILAWHPWTATVSFVAIGATTAAELAALGIGRVTVADGTDVEALAAAVMAVMAVTGLPAEAR